MTSFKGKGVGILYMTENCGLWLGIGIPAALGLKA